MAEIDGGALSFKTLMDNDQLNSAIDETMRRIQGFSDGFVGAGDVVDKTTTEMIANVRDMLSKIGTACMQHESTIEALESEYSTLGNQIGDAFQAGCDEEMNALRERQQAVAGEIKVRKQLLNELRSQSNALEEHAERMERELDVTKKTEQAHDTLRSKIRDLKEEMARLRADGIDENSAAYKRLVNELGRLQDIQGDIAAQGKIMANDNNQFAGVLSGLQGVVGGFTAASSAISLFSEKNEDLQKVMLKVQQLMSITMGLQQVATTLNKDSAFSLVTLTGVREWWNKVVEAGRGKQVEETAAKVADTAATGAQTTAVAAETAAETANAAAKKGTTTAEVADTAAKGANTVATGAQTAAATAGTAANIGLAGAFRMVGAAIKSIPVFGWILAGISGVIALVSGLTKKSREAKKEMEAFGKALNDAAYKPIGKIEELSAKWNALGDDLKAKEAFVKANAKAFDELGASVYGVTDAENLLVRNKDAFINAQIAKAKAIVYEQQAAEAVKELLEAEQKLAKTPKAYVSKKGTYTDGYGTERKGTVIQKSSEWEKAEKAVQDAQKKVDDLYNKVTTYESEAIKTMENAGIAATQSYAEGTLGAIEEAISLKQKALKNLTDNEAYKAAMTEIEALQKQADKITGKKTGGGSSKDPFLEKLAKYKSEYQRFVKWINSGDAILQQSAQKEFAGLLAEGATYIDWLKKQRDTILAVDVANRTKAQNEQLRKLNNAIAEETKQTVLDAFNQELNDQLSNAKTVLDVLNIIEQKRKELANDGTEVDDAKRQSLDDAEKNAKEQAREQIAGLLDTYAGYVERKRILEQDFARDMALLAKARAEAETDAEIAAVEAAIANRKKAYESDQSEVKENADYDALLSEYGSFEQKKLAIVEEFERKRKIAQEQGDADLVERLNEAQAKALSQLASSELTESSMWEMLFGNLDELTASQITTLVNEIESRFSELSGVFNPVDLNEIRNKLNEAKAILYRDNPFKQLSVAIKEIFKDAGDDSKKSAEQIKKNWKKLGDATEASFKFVEDAVNSCDFLKDAIGDVGATAISAMTTCATTAIAVATAIKTAEKASVILAIIQAALVVVQAVVNVVKSICGNNDANIEKQIGKWKTSVDDLKNAYAQLSWEIDRTLGAAVYKQQQAAIANMKQQQAYLKQMWEAEESKKKTDQDKVREYKEQYAQLSRDIQDMIDSISDDILSTTAKDFASELGDALADAFGKGEDASKAFEETVNDVLKNAIVNQLKKRFLEQQLQGALDSLERSMGYFDKDNNFVFDGLTDAEIAAFKAKVQAAANNYNQALEIYKDLFKEIAGDEEESSLTGAVKGVSEETASILAGQINAIRVNQLDTTAILRQALQTLNTIAANTAFNHHLAKIDRIITILEKSASDDSLRSHGLS